ncbi:hypothetical protein Patl1_00820 [Pistacia atlantica]|uniref:Uncharacterized protein n=1 Tax=Pistacia atlantica TaxID=434234 RepID=A0ACC1C6Y7_9ROSI|nr:hypothetical protein Patl1_00820 [Pistacia atlantica]
MSKLRLEGKVAIITGAASGIGEAAAKLFAEHGAFVIIADVQDIEETVAYAIEKYGPLDIMYSNAGILGPLGSILDLEMDQFDNTIAVNLRGSVLAVKHAARAMVANKIRGSIICTGSLASSLGGSGPHAYTMSKHGLLGLVRAASGELGRHGIRVNCVSPNGVSTPMACKVANSDPSTVDARSAQLANLKGIVLKAEHVAQSALFLASDESVYISGHNLAVDGGFSAISSINRSAYSLQGMPSQYCLDADNANITFNCIHQDKRSSQEKVAIITGVASGIVEASTKLFAEHGAFIVIADTRDDLGNRVVATIGPNKASYRHCDLRDEKQVEETMAYAIEKYGSLDIIYNNAGVLGRPMDSILDMNIEDLDNRTAANLRASAQIIKHGARAMMARNIAGSIICSGSVASSKGGSGPPAYTISKHSLLGLVRSALSELGR